MRVVDCEQRSDEWRRLRSGVITASNAHKLLTIPKRLNYAQELIVERLTGVPTEVVQSDAMAWGVAHEADALLWYWWESDNEVTPVGFCFHDDEPSWGASPDGLVADVGLVEIKCPYNVKNHIAHLIDGPGPAYEAQMQWQMLVTGRQWCDFVSYSPAVPDEHKGCIHRVMRSEEIIEQLKGGAKWVMEYVEKMGGLKQLPLESGNC